MQGHRILHHVEELRERYNRVTLIASFYTYDPRIADPQVRKGPPRSDPMEVAVSEWSQFSTVVATHKLSTVAELAAMGELSGAREGLVEAEEIIKRAVRYLDEFKSGQSAAGVR
jgi:hypothetical protein